MKKVVIGGEYGIYSIHSIFQKT